jgi:hypothetical protein
MDMTFWLPQTEAALAQVGESGESRDSKMRCPRLAWGTVCGALVNPRAVLYWEESNTPREYHCKKEICYAEHHRIHR